jgi:hypothetical protein
LTSQSAAATSAASASTSASSALTSATSAATSYDEFDDRYLGAKASPPTVDNDGNALLTGALYWNTGVNKMYVWSGSAWTEISSSAEIIAYKYTVAGGATSVSGADDNGLTLTYTVGKEQVYINGVLQVRGSDYTASTGSSITGISAMIASDIVTVLAFTSFSVSDTYTQAQADAKFFQTANAFLAGKNKLINGDFNINQRAFTSSTTHAVYCYDRWLQVAVDGTTTFSAQTFTPGAAPVAGYESTNFLRIITTGQTAANARSQIVQRFEDVRTFGGQTITISFWAKAATGTPKLLARYDQVFGTGGSTSTSNYGSTTTLSTSWARYSTTISVPSLVGKTIGTGFFAAAVFTVSAGTDFPTENAAIGIQSNTFDIWGVQLEAGSIATPFQTATGTIQGELAACQRYAWNPLFNNSAANQSVGPAFADSTSSARVVIKFPVTMRNAPSYAFQTVANWSLGYPGATALVSTTSEVLTTEQAQFVVGTAAAAITSGTTYQLYRPGTTNLLLFSAEL